MRYEQMTPREALEDYCNWILSQMPKFREPPYEWYFLFYPIRTLLLGAKLLGRGEYAEAVWPHLDHYIGEQLPNGALSSNYRGKPATELSQKEIEDLLRCGKFNLADNGSNVHALIQGAMFTSDTERRKRYLDAARKWLDCWVPIWALPNGAYGNGIWVGHKLCAPYSMAINVCSALSAFTLVSGDRRYVENAERFALFQCDHWHESGVPIRFNVYPMPEANSLIGDFARIFYLMEGLAWTHYASSDSAVRERIASRLAEWIDADLLARWPEDRSWFNMNKCPLNQVLREGYRDSSTDDGLRFYWQAAKCCGVPSFFSYYDKYIAGRADLRSRAEKGGQYLAHPLKARMLGVYADDVEPDFCMQATGFAGLTLAEAIEPGSSFAAFDPQPLA